jgi:hypothetical protein
VRRLRTDGSASLFDQIPHSLSSDNVDFVKIDIEGAELEGLIGMRQSLQECKPIILCEVPDHKADIVHHNARKDELMQLLRNLNYNVLQLIKSADRRHIIDAKKIDKFTSSYWTLENKDLCDYIFIPEGKQKHVLSALLKADEPRLRGVREFQGANDVLYSQFSEYCGSVWVCCKHFLCWPVRISNPFSEVRRVPPQGCYQEASK